MDYLGKELEMFDKANIWRKYVYLLIKKYLKEDILEVGAGIGSFTNNYKDNFKNITITELDKKNIKELKRRFKKSKIKITFQYTEQIKKVQSELFEKV